jgi:chromosome partitioning protein
MTEIVAFFNNKGGVGKTTSAYHIAHMMARNGVRVVSVDLDPQANMTAGFFDEDQLELLWGGSNSSVLSGVEPLLRGLGDIRLPEAPEVAERLFVLPGDLGLSRFEENLSDAWPRAYDGNEAALRTTTAFYRIIRGISEQLSADVAIVDVGPNLGAINRSALLAADHIVIPLAADLFSLQGLRNLGPTLSRWRESWRQNVLPKASNSEVAAPSGAMHPIGYIVLQHAVRMDRPVKAYDRWLKRIPTQFAESVLDSPTDKVVDPDPYRLASLRNYRSLMPLSQDARKPMFDLRAADGALGSTGRLVQTCYREFHELTTLILQRIGYQPKP